MGNPLGYNDIIVLLILLVNIKVILKLLFCVLNNFGEGNFMFYDNLKAECERQGLKLTPIVLECGGTKGIIGGWKNGAAPRSDIVMKLAVRLKVPTDYLLFGETRNSIISSSENEFITLFKSLSDTDKIRVIERAQTLAEIAAEKAAEEAAQKKKTAPRRRTLELFDLPASAGTGVYLSSNYSKPISVISTPESEQADYAIRISGNSMEPDFHDGDIALVESCEDIEIGEIGIFILDGEGFIKEYGGYRLISLNPEYDDISLKEYDSISCRGRVLGKAEQS